MTGVSVVQKFIQALRFTGLLFLKPLSPFVRPPAPPNSLHDPRLVAQAPNLTSQPPSSEGTKPRLCCLSFYCLFCFVWGGYSALFGDRDSDCRLASSKLATTRDGLYQNNFPQACFLSRVPDVSRLKLSTRNGERGPGDQEEVPGSMPRVDGGLDSDVALGDGGRTIRTLRKAKLSLRLAWAK